MIPFIDLAAQQKRIRPQLEAAIGRVLDHGGYIMGPEIRELETELTAFCGASHTLTCSSGTDALVLPLMAKGIKAGDAVFVPAFTFAATAEAVAFLGATVVFIDVCPNTFNIDCENLEKGIAKAKALGLCPKGIIAVDLYGQAADYDSLNSIAANHGLWVLADAAQSFGGTYKGRKVGTLAETTATSFFPSKPLGGYGDGGAVFTESAEMADILKSLRVHGQGTTKYDNVRIGMNGRCDTLQAAILLEKLKIFPEEITLRQKVADRYNEGLAAVAITPVIENNCQSAWAQYTVKVDPDKRAPLMEALKAEGIPTMIHYNAPLHTLKAYKDYPCAADTLPVCESLSHCVMSLPMHPYLEAETQDHIIKQFCEISHRLQMKRVA
ncbi:DegT/DnrJ/EryC1/StrS aminotransferase family protein [Kamptonema cortianum]|jgi:dTDP-4-amino-4,6-dideoxygalactose transaminase|nr:DegT/DnrJ/EryC1/StrS aminotransferase family protein [Geitlerinema splendidum]MDK3159058.1 DegT/DnrJ/EryC1/StrS aminotransferase family protein [Kamptonema cortianum]